MKTSEKIFGYIGTTLVFLSGIALVFVAGMNPQLYPVKWQIGNVLMGCFIIIASVKILKGSIASAMGKAAVFFGGIALLFVNAFWRMTPLDSLACVVVSLVMLVSVGVALLKANAENLEPAGR